LRLILLILTFFLCACKRKTTHEPKNIERSFYYWKSVFKLSAKEKYTLDTLKINTLYIKFFDVTWDSKSKMPFPVAQLIVRDSVYLQDNSLNIIPTIFITNESIAKIDSASTDDLATKIFSLEKLIAANNHFKKITEIQIDCDWTAKTRYKYFALLSKLQKLDSNINFTATIRLHQIKYANSTGIPPIKRGMLMCYNMGNLTNKNTKNSILEIAELKKYIGNLHHYPLALDVALPLFDWKVHFSKDVFKGLIKDLPMEGLTNKAFIKKDNIYLAAKDTLLFGYNFNTGDIIRVEESKYDEILNAGTLIANKLKNKNLRLSLYHLDTVTLNKFTTHEMENIFNNMR
jgi:hypothetical protein